jgi:hypothetical protein
LSSSSSPPRLSPPRHPLLVSSSPDVSLVNRF